LQSEPAASERQKKSGRATERKNGGKNRRARIFAGSCSDGQGWHMIRWKPVMALPLNGNNWIVVKRRLKETYPQITDDDLDYIENKKDEMLDHLQRRLGTSRIEIAWFVEEAIAHESGLGRPEWSAYVLSDESRRVPV